MQLAMGRILLMALGDASRGLQPAKTRLGNALFSATSHGRVLLMALGDALGGMPPIKSRLGNALLTMPWSSSRQLKVHILLPSSLHLKTCKVYSLQLKHISQSTGLLRTLAAN